MVIAQRVRARLAQLLSFLVISCCASARAEGLLALDKLPPETDLGTEVEVLIDESGALTFADVKDATFTRSDQPELAFGFDYAAIWLRFSAQNARREPTRWVLELGEPLLDHVQLFVLHRSGASEAYEGGDALPFESRAIAHVRPAFELSNPGYDRATYYLRVQSDDVLRAPLHAYTPAAYTAHHERQTAGQWLFYGVLLMVAAYNFGVYGLVRRDEYMRYAIVSLSLCLVLICTNGHQAQLFFPSAPALSGRLFVVSMALAAWAVVLFMKDVVSYRPSVQYKVPRYERLSWLAAGITAYCALVPVGLALRSLAWLFLLVTLAAPIILHRLAITAIPELKLYRRSWWAFALTIPLAVLRYANVLPCWSIFEWALPAGFAVHGIMTSLALPAWASGMESKLAVVNEQLTHNVEELRQALTRAEEANQKAQRATKAKDEFVATMSHELRTPLNAIINIPQGLIGEFATLRSAKCSACSASYLLDQADVIGAATACSECKQLGTLVEGSKVKYRGDEARCLRFLQKIERSGQHLLQMVNGVLDYSKLEAGRFELVLGPVELEPLIREVSDQMSDLAQRKNIQLELQAGAAHKRPLMADLLRLKQVLINLLANAIKFSEAHSTVTIRWSSLPDGELIEVEDRGIGIAPEHQERIFSSFEQVHKGDTRKYGGTGLGLSISRSLVRMHGGELSVRSELGKGSTFVIRLPRMPTSTNSRPSGELRAAVDNSNGEALVVQGARS